MVGLTFRTLMLASHLRTSPYLESMLRGSEQGIVHCLGAVYLPDAWQLTGQEEKGHESHLVLTLTAGIHHDNTNCELVAGLM